MPRNVKVSIVACFYEPPQVQTRLETESATTPVSATSPGTPSTTTTTIPPSTTTMNYCTEEKGMNQPLSIRPEQVSSNPPSNQTTPPADINPTTSTSTPGLDFPSTNPLINITLTQPATLTLIYLPIDRPDQPSNVDEFVVVFVYPNGTTSKEYPSEIPSVSGKTTPSPTSVPSETTTTAPTPSGVFPPSDRTPQVNLSPRFEVPEGTVVIINVTSTTNDLPPAGVCTKHSFVLV